MSSPRPARPAQAASSGAGGSPRASAGAEVALRSLAIVPARLGSTRLARKMLLAETGMPLFAHTARAVLGSGVVTRVVVATDSDEILAASRAAGVDAVMTSSAHKSGTDRVHEAAQLVTADGARYDVVINVQGDEPELDASALAGLIASFADPTVEMASLYAPHTDAASFTSPNAVKVVVARNGDALYFSRAPIPSRAHPGSTCADGADAVKLHLGVYGFRPAALARFVALPHSALEAAENLEQLRWLDAGHKIRMARASRASRGIDTPEDYAAFVARHTAAGRR